MKLIISITFSSTDFVIITQIVGEPSKETAESMAKEEQDRVAKQRDHLGDKGLKENAENLDKATEENEVR